MWAWTAVALAAEGMWLPQQMPALAPALTEHGFALDPTTLGDPLRAPLSAIVGLGFCSASFVSPEGLLLTNLHCADGFLGFASKDGEQLGRDGFVAATRAEERWAGPAARLYVLESIEDVTAPLRAAIEDPDVTDALRVQVLDRAESELVGRCEKTKHRRCKVASYDGGTRYELQRSLELEDVRLVWAPPEKVGFFGGDLDNFEWPRHDADVAALRAYVGKNGKPAEHDPKNVPLRPGAWLPVAAEGVDPGDPVMVAGYPGGTRRYRLPEELAFAVEVAYPTMLEDLAVAERVLAEHAERSEVAAERLSAGRHGLANSRKYLRGVLDNVAGGPVLADKRELARAVDAAVTGDAAAHLAELRTALAAEQAAFGRTYPASSLLRGSLLSVAHTAYRWSLERPERDLDREPGFQDRDRERVLDRWDELDEKLWLPAERDLFAARLDRALAQAVAPVEAFVSEVGGRDAALDLLFADPALARAEVRRALLDQPASAHEASTDPWTRLAVRLERDLLGPERQAEREREGALLRLRPHWIAAVRATRTGEVYPDANNTLRITFGRVTGYAPRDGLLATPQTSLAGLVQKHDRPEYEAPSWLVEAAAQRPELPVNFLSDLDTTGGNSGSATLDAQGRLVGLLFDGNYESMAGDWQYDPALTRSIHVDVRYVGWLLARDPRAGALTAELGLSR